jgi:DnaK suppressor protein
LIGKINILIFNKNRMFKEMPTNIKKNEAKALDLNSVKAELLLQKEQILKNLEAISKKDVNQSDGQSAIFPEFGDKPDENAQEVGEFASMIGSQEILEKTLTDIEKALKKIESGTYGVCQYCGGPIGEKRLEVRPTASSCVACKTKLQESE